MFNPDTGLTAISRAIDWMKALKSESLVDYTRTARVEPIALVDADCVFHENIEDIMQSLLSQFTGFYLIAVSLSCTVGKIDVKRTLDRLNPKRSPLDSGMDQAGYLLATESYRFRLPKPGDFRISLESEITDELARERMDLDHRKFDYQTQHDAKKMVFDSSSFLHKAGVDEQTRTERLAEAERTYQLNLDKLGHTKAMDAAKAAYQEANDARKMVFDANAFEYKAGLDKQAREDRLLEAQRLYDLNVEKMGHTKALALVETEMKKEGLSLQRANLQLARDKMDRDLTASELAFGKDTMQTIKELSNLSVGKLFEVQITDGLHKASIPVSVRILASTMPTESLVHILSLGNKDISMKERWHAFKAGELDGIRDMVLCRDLIDAHQKTLMHDKDGIYSNLVSRTRNNTLSAIVSANPTVAAASNMAVISKATADMLESSINGRLKDYKTREKVFKSTSLMIMAVLEKDWGRVTFYTRGIDVGTTVSVKSLKASNKGSGPDVSDILRAYQLGNSPSL